MALSGTRLARPFAMLAISAVLLTGCFDLALGAEEPAAATDDVGEPKRASGDMPDPLDESDLTPESTSGEDDIGSAGESTEPVTDEAPPSPPRVETSTIGAGPVGVSCPDDAVRISPGDDLQAAINKAGDYATVCIASGLHRVTKTVEPRWGSTLLFEQGAILDGSRPVTNWTRRDGAWVATGQTQSVDASDDGLRCTANPAACEYEDLFMDGTPMTRVLRRADLRSGTFFFDEAADTIEIADNPSGHKLEATVADTAIDAGGAHGVTLRGATIQKFGKHGIETSEDWLVANNEVRYVHSHALLAYGRTKVLDNYFHHAGSLGILVDEGEGMLIEGNELAYNNYLSFDVSWHAGATKITGSVGTIVRGNYSHHNTGDGWWFDWDNNDTLVVDNRFEHNSRFGLLVEASFDTEIRNNDFVANGTRMKHGGAGVWITTSKDTEVHSNVFDGNRHSTLAAVTTDRGRSSTYGTRETTGLNVHDNTFILDEGYVGVPFGKPDIYAARSQNRFVDNTYRVPDHAGDWWLWGTPDGDDHTSYDWSKWNDAGNDTGGALTTP